MKEGRPTEMAYGCSASPDAEPRLFSRDLRIQGMEDQCSGREDHDHEMSKSVIDLCIYILALEV